MRKSTGKPKSRPVDEEVEPETVKGRQAPGRTIEAREAKLISMSVDEAERQLRNRTISSQVLLHYLKQGTVIAELEKEHLRKENLLLQAKADQIKSQQKTEELYQNALSAMRRYQGQEEVIDADE